MPDPPPDVIDLCSDDEALDNVNERVLCTHPMCNRWIVLQDLESHELCHRLEEEEVERRDEGGRQTDKQEEDDFDKLRQRYGFINAPRPGHCFTCGQEGHWSGDSACPSNQRSHFNLNDLAVQQKRDDQHQRALECQPLIPLLELVLREQKLTGNGLYEVYLCGPGICLLAGERTDAGWSCGYRNIGMMASHFLSKEGGHHEISKALFAGSGFVPDVRSLQAWLEAGWAAGYDPQG